MHRLRNPKRACFDGLKSPYHGSVPEGLWFGMEYDASCVDSAEEAIGFEHSALDSCVFLL